MSPFLLAVLPQCLGFLSFSLLSSTFVTVLLSFNGFTIYGPCFCFEANWDHGRGGQKEKKKKGTESYAATGHSPNSSLQPQQLRRALAFEVAFCSLKYLMKACCRPGKGRSLNLLASLLKQACPGFCNKEPRSTGRAGGGLWEHRGGVPAPVVRLALAFLPPAALTLLLTGSCIVSAEAVCDLQNETFLPVVCNGYYGSPPAPSAPSLPPGLD